MRKKFLGAALALAAVLAIGLHTAPAKAAVLTSGAPNGTAGGGVCADVAFDSITPGTKVSGVACNASPAEQFELNGYTIFSIGGQRCLDVQGQGTAAGSPIDSYYCTGGANQKWEYLAGQVYNPVSGRCLDSGNLLGGQLYINTCNGSSTQQWQVK